MNLHHKSSEQIGTESDEVRLAQADPQKFAVLYERYYKQLFVFVYRRTNDEDVSADIVSQTFLKALINIKQYRFQGVPFSAWLFRIAFNEMNMYFRKNSVDRFVSIEHSGISEILDETGEDENEESAKKLKIALKQMKQEELELIELRFFEKHSFAEVGVILGITENNAKVKVYRILDKIKKIF